MTQIRKLLAMLVEGNAYRDNAPNIIPNTTSPSMMPKSHLWVGGAGYILFWFHF
jgi:hypothetical protein